MSYLHPAALMLIIFVIFLIWGAWKSENKGFTGGGFSVPFVQSRTNSTMCPCCRIPSKQEHSYLFIIFFTFASDLLFVWLIDWFYRSTLIKKRSSQKYVIYRVRYWISLPLGASRMKRVKMMADRSYRPGENRWLLNMDVFAKQNKTKQPFHFIHNR